MAPFVGLRGERSVRCVWGGGCEVSLAGAGWIRLVRLELGFREFVVERRADPNHNPRVWMDKLVLTESYQES